MILAIGDIFDFIRNGMSVKQSSDIDGLPITRIETIWNAEIDLSRVGYAGVQFVNAKDYLLKDGDILFSHINSVAHIGKCALYSQEHGELVHGMNLLCFRPNQTKILPKYALYTLRSNQFKDQLARSIKKAVNQASVTIGDIKKIQIEIPPLAEQRRIAAILDKALLVKRKRELAMEKLDELAQSIFIEMFGNPIENPKKITQIPLKEVCTLINGRAFKPNEWEEKGLPIIRIQNLNDETKSFNFSTKNFPSKFMVNPGDILFSWSGTPGTSFGCFKWTREKGWLNQHIFKVQIDNSLNGDFFITQMNLKLNELISKAHGGVGLQHVTKGMLDETLLLVPEISFQQKYAENVIKIHEIKKNIIESLKSTSRLISSIQSQVFSGQL